MLNAQLSTPDSRGGGQEDRLVTADYSDILYSQL
jgi:hypothetical protein